MGQKTPSKKADKATSKVKDNDASPKATANDAVDGSIHERATHATTGVSASQQNDDLINVQQPVPEEERKHQSSDDSSSSTTTQQEDEQIADVPIAQEQLSEELNSDGLPHSLETWLDNCEYHRSALHKAAEKVLRLAHRVIPKINTAAALRYRSRNLISRRNYWQSTANPQERITVLTELRLFDIDLGREAANALQVMDEEADLAVSDAVDEQTRQQISMLFDIRHFTNDHYKRFELAGLEYGLSVNDDVTSYKSKASNASAHKVRTKLWCEEDKKVKHTNTVLPPPSSGDSKQSGMTERQLGRAMRAVINRAGPVKRQKTESHACNSTLHVISERDVPFPGFSRETRDVNEATIGMENVTVVKKHLERSEAMARFSNRAIGLFYGSFINKNPVSEFSSLLINNSELPSEWFVYASMFPNQTVSIVNTQQPFHFNSLVAHDDLIACNNAAFGMEPIGMSVLVDDLGDAAIEVARQIMGRSGAIKFVLLRVAGKTAKRIIERDFYSFTQNQQTIVDGGDAGYPANLNIATELAYLVGSQKGAGFEIELVNDSVMRHVSHEQVLPLLQGNQLISEQLLPLHEGEK